MCQTMACGCGNLGVWDSKCGFYNKSKAQSRIPRYRIGNRDPKMETSLFAFVCSLSDHGVHRSFFFPHALVITESLSSAVPTSRATRGCAKHALATRGCAKHALSVRKIMNSTQKWFFPFRCHQTCRTVFLNMFQKFPGHISKNCPKQSKVIQFFQTRPNKCRNVSQTC